MTFPIFDPDNIKIIAVPLEQWLRELPQDTMLRVFHTKDESVKMTWLECKNGKR
jgi:hypothetical protein